LEALTRNEVPKQILALTFEQHSRIILKGTFSLYEDHNYQDWFMSANFDESSKKINKCQLLDIPMLFQIDANGGDMDQSERQPKPNKC
jgi:hypothetical protein